MELVKLSSLNDTQCRRLLEDNYTCCVAFKGATHPFVAPLLYLFNGRHLFFLATKYGQKIDFFEKDPHVMVEVEQKKHDLSEFLFVTLAGRLVEVTDPEEKHAVRRQFVQLIQQKNLSRNIMFALGHTSQEELEVLEHSERTLVWKLVDVQEIRGLGRAAPSG